MEFASQEETALAMVVTARWLPVLVRSFEKGVQDLGLAVTERSHFVDQDGKACPTLGVRGRRLIDETYAKAQARIKELAGRFEWLRAVFVEDAQADGPARPSSLRSSCSRHSAPGLTTRSCGSAWSTWRCADALRAGRQVLGSGRSHGGERDGRHPLRDDAARPGAPVQGRLTAMRAAQAVLRAGRENPSTQIDRIDIYGADGKLVFEANCR